MARTLLLPLALLLAAGPLAAQRRAGSIYDPDRGPRNPIVDKTARRPGDVLTVLVSENQDLRNEESSTLDKESDLDYQLTNLNIAPNAFSVLPGLTGGSNSEFEGTANYQKRGAFSARLTVIVVDALPNGNLVLSGRREIRIDGETKVIDFSGVVRRYDIRADNTVLSERVANAKISYQGSGVLTDSTNRIGLGKRVARAIEWLWPF